MSSPGAQCSLFYYRAYKELNPGEEITCDYGCVYFRHTKGDRHKTLASNFYFQCSCEACLGDWPILQDLAESDPVFRCPNCSSGVEVTRESVSAIISCSNCKIENDFTSENQQLKELDRICMNAIKKAVSGYIEEALTILEKELTLLRKILIPPSVEIIKCQIMLFQCYALVEYPLYSTSR